MSTLMFWNKQNSNSNSSNNNNNNSSNQNNEAKNSKNGRNWLHAPDVLLNGHVAYLVKFLGSTPVQQAKGIEVVKEAIRRLQFTQQIKKAEGGDKVKTKKVEITVSIDGVAVQIPRTQTILHQFPLHKISYCADEKKFFSFIAKTGNNNTTLTNGETINMTTAPAANEEGHECFVFVSNKLASDITLTIGQAFDLAYRRYVNDGGKHIELVKAQQQNKHLENTVTVYRQRLRDLTELVSKSDMEKLLLRLSLRDICEVPPAPEIGVDKHVASINGSKTPDLGIDVSTPNNDDQLLIETSPKLFAPIVPPRNITNQLNSTFDALKPSVGTKLEGLLLNSDSDSDFDPRAEECETTNGHKISNDMFGFEPQQKTLGQQLFVNNNNNINNNLLMNGSMPTMIPLINGPPTSPPPLLAPPPKATTPRRAVVQNGNGLTMNGNQDLFGSTPFSVTPSAFDTNLKKGLVFDTDDFNLEDLDPLRK